MKNSPELEWLRKLETRLGNYAEAPDEQVWEYITSKVGKRADAGWMKWTDYAVMLVGLVVLLWSSISVKEQGPAASEFAGVHAQLPRERNVAGEQGSPSKKTVESRKHEASISSEISAHKNVDPIGSTIAPGYSAMDSGVSLQPLSTAATDKGEYIKVDSVLEVSPLTDGLDRKRNEVIVPARRKAGFTFYAAVSPSLTFQRLIPVANDGVIIESVDVRPVFSSDRLNVALQAGIQSRIGRRFEIFGGVSLHRQSQTFSYRHLSGGNASVKEDDLDYSLMPETSRKSLHYDVLNVGAEAGIFYCLRFDALIHKIGAGLLWQHGMMKTFDGEIHDEAMANYLFYQILYRNEFAISNSMNVFFQPFYQHALRTGDVPNAPFQLNPYRAGLSIGFVYHAW
jgi:hypothetical protein